MAENDKKKVRIRDRMKGKGSRICRICGTSRALIRKYSLYVCRRCFREMGESIGFRKYGG